MWAGFSLYVQWCGVVWLGGVGLLVDEGVEVQLGPLQSRRLGPAGGPGPGQRLGHVLAVAESPPQTRERENQETSHHTDTGMVTPCTRDFLYHSPLLRRLGPPAGLPARFGGRGFPLTCRGARETHIILQWSKDDAAPGRLFGLLQTKDTGWWRC